MESWRQQVVPSAGSAVIAIDHVYVTRHPPARMGQYRPHRGRLTRRYARHEPGNDRYRAGFGLRVVELARRMVQNHVQRYGCLCAQKQLQQWQIRSSAYVQNPAPRGQHHTQRIALGNVRHRDCYRARDACHRGDAPLIRDSRGP